MRLSTSLYKKTLFIISLVVLTWAIFSFTRSVSAHVGDAYCSPNTCAGQNAYLKILDCAPNGNNTSCNNNGTQNNVVMYCQTSDCNGGAPRGGGCSGLTPFQTATGWDCPAPKDLTVNCCNNSGGGGATPTSGGSSTSYWRVSGNTKNSTNGLLNDVTLTFDWPVGSPQTIKSGAYGTGVFIMTKNAANVDSSGNFKVSAYKAGSWQFYATNSSPGSGCSRTDGPGSTFPGRS